MACPARNWQWPNHITYVSGDGGCHWMNSHQWFSHARLGAAALKAWTSTPSSIRHHWPRGGNQKPRQKLDRCQSHFCRRGWAPWRHWSRLRGAPTRALVHTKLVRSHHWFRQQIRLFAGAAGRRCPGGAGRRSVRAGSAAGGGRAAGRRRTIGAAAHRAHAAARRSRAVCGRAARRQRQFGHWSGASIGSAGCWDPW